MTTLFSFEVPFNHLKDFEENQDFNFCLSFLLSEKKYRSYYENNVIHILDNSFNELQRPTPPAEMVSLYNTYHPEKIVSPDAYSWTSIQVVEAFCEMKAFLPVYKVIGIFKSAEELLLLSKAGCVNFASSYSYRSVLPQWTLMFPSHYLGLLNPMEIRIFNPPTCDTSMPIKLAIEHYPFDTWLLDGCPHIQSRPDFFYEKMSVEEIKIAKENIRRLRELCIEQTTMSL